MPTVVNAARATSKDGAARRECTCCGQLRPLPPDALFCDECAGPAQTNKSAGAWSR